MCGIAGIFHLRNHHDVSLESIKRMINVLRHRGPDESGIYLDDCVGLGHTRLSILDLSKGSQPIYNEDKTLWIIYNGEVFNYIELKDYLIKKGHHFYTNTDTEVILHLYEEYGSSCLDKLNGQFAFAIWDFRNKELFLARDRVGICPLYYTLQNGSFIFGSEIKSIFTMENVCREIDPLAINQMFTYWTNLPCKSIFKNINELPPGHYLKISKNQVIIQRYWDVYFSPPDDQSDLSIEYVCNKIQELLIDAIRVRLRSDVPVGCYLSGGLDSSIITSLVVNNFNNTVKTFGLRFKETKFDEGDFQDIIVSSLKSNYSYIIVSNEMISSVLDKVLWHTETPLLRTAPVPLFLLSNLVNKDGFKVVLTGEGADEVFGGYNIFREAKVRNFWAKQPNSEIRGLLIGRLYPYVFDNSKTRAIQSSFFANGLEKSNDPFFSHHIRWKNTSRIKTFLSDEFKAFNNINNDYDELKQILPESFEKWDFLAKAQYLEMKLFLSNYLLSSQGDRVSMANSVEIRVPYLDHRIIEFMGEIPSKWKIKGLNEKYILKKSFKEILPDKIVNRPKHPYRAPIRESLLDNNMFEYFQEMLSECILKSFGMFDANKVKKLLNKFHTLKNLGESENMALIGILSSQIVYDKFIHNFSGRVIYPGSLNIIIDRRTNKI
jgi:asparagine synthase (glutamine-hydrolysing)